MRNCCQNGPLIYTGNKTSNLIEIVHFYPIFFVHFGGGGGVLLAILFERKPTMFLTSRVSLPVRGLFDWGRTKTHLFFPKAGILNVFALAASQSKYFLSDLGRVLKNGTEYSTSDNRPEFEQPRDLVSTIRSLL